MKTNTTPIEMEPTIDSLLHLTDEFFLKHWNQSEIENPPPEWSETYYFSGSLPNHDKQGVYAFIKDRKVVYIGVASSRGAGKYRGHGLGKRFQSYSRVINNTHTPTDERLIDAGGIMTIGFALEHAYLASALELYLLGRLATEHNSNRPGS